MIHARARHKQPLLIVWACIRRLDLPSTLHSSPSLRPPSTWCWHGTHALHDEQLSTSASAPLAQVSFEHDFVGSNSLDFGWPDSLGLSAQWLDGMGQVWRPRHPVRPSMRMHLTRPRYACI